MLRVTPAMPYDKSYFVRTLKWAKDCNMANGIPFDDPLESSAGIRMVLLVPGNTPMEKCEQAIAIGRSRRDVVVAKAVSIPDEWFIEAGLDPDLIRANLN